MQRSLNEIPLFVLSWFYAIIFKRTFNSGEASLNFTASSSGICFIWGFGCYFYGAPFNGALTTCGYIISMGGLIISFGFAIKSFLTSIISHDESLSMTADIVGGL